MLIKLSSILILVIFCKCVSGYLRVCYYTNWAQYRPDGGKYMPENINPKLCSHVIFAFGKLQGNELIPFEWNDDSTQWSLGMYAKINNLKQANPQLKTLLAVGGWNAGSLPFSDMVATIASRKDFINSTVHFLRHRKFDGLDLDWEYPAMRGGRPEDKQNLAALISELSKAFEQDSYQTGQARLLLTAAVPAGKSNIDAGYDIPKIVRNLDFINIMTYDMHGSWETKTGHNSPLFGRAGESLDDAMLNMDWAVKYWTTQGAPKHKLIVGFGLYGRSFQLANAADNTMGAATIGAGRAGKYTRETGFMAYYEVCEEIKTGATRVLHAEHKSPYIVKGDQWVGYDDEESVISKVQWVKQNGYGGVMIWSLALDDFSGTFCNRGPYPLLTAINRELGVVFANGVANTIQSTGSSAPLSERVPSVNAASVNNATAVLIQPTATLVEINPRVLTNFPSHISAIPSAVVPNTHPAGTGVAPMTSAFNMASIEPVTSNTDVHLHSAGTSSGVISNNGASRRTITPTNVASDSNQVIAANFHAHNNIAPDLSLSVPGSSISNIARDIVPAEVATNNFVIEPVAVSANVASNNILHDLGSAHPKTDMINSPPDSLLMNVPPEVLQRLLANLTHADPNTPISIGIPHAGHHDHHPPHMPLNTHSQGHHEPAVRIDVGAGMHHLHDHNMLPNVHDAHHHLSADAGNIMPGNIAVADQHVIPAVHPVAHPVTHPVKHTSAHTAPVIPVANNGGFDIAGLESIVNIPAAIVRRMSKPNPNLNFSFSSSSSSNSNSSSSSSNSSSSSRNINIGSPQRGGRTTGRNNTDILSIDPSSLKGSEMSPRRITPLDNPLISLIDNSQLHQGVDIPSGSVTATVIPISSINSLSDILANYTDVPMGRSILIPDETNFLSPDVVLRELSLTNVLANNARTSITPRATQRQRVPSRRANSRIRNSPQLSNNRIRSNTQLSSNRIRNNPQFSNNRIRNNPQFSNNRIRNNPQLISRDGNEQRFRASDARQPADQRTRINPRRFLPTNDVRSTQRVNQSQRRTTVTPTDRGRQFDLNNLALRGRQSNAQVNPILLNRQRITQFRPNIQRGRETNTRRVGTRRVSPNFNTVLRNRQNQVGARVLQSQGRNRRPRIMMVGGALSPEQSTTIRRTVNNNFRRMPTNTF